MVEYIPEVKMKMVREAGGGRKKVAVKSPVDLLHFFQNHLGCEDREHFIAVLLDTKNQVTGFHTVSIGCLNGTLIHPREVFKAAILGNSASIILVHNHPSGNPVPSKEDMDVTDRLVKAGEIIGIKVMDHLIIGEEEHYYSFKEGGLI